MRLYVIVSVVNDPSLLRERLIQLDQALKASGIDDWQGYLSDGGMFPRATEEVRSFQQSHPHWILAEHPLFHPSIARVTQIALRRFPNPELRDAVLVLPSNVAISSVALGRMKEALLDNAVRWGGFAKRYEGASWGLRAYVFWENWVRGWLLRSLTWANGIYYRVALFERGKLPDAGFLEDVVLCDELRESAPYRKQFAFISVPLLVSSPAYLTGALKRVLLNLEILAFFRLGLKRPEELQELYLSSGTDSKAKSA